MARVLLTGTLGNVDARALEQLSNLGYATFVFDLKNRRNEKVAARLAMRLRFTTLWSDLRRSASVALAMHLISLPILIEIRDHIKQTGL